MNSFQKLAYEIQRGQYLREKLAAWTPAMATSLENLRAIEASGQLTPVQHQQLRYLVGKNKAHVRGVDLGRYSKETRDVFAKGRYGAEAGRRGARLSADALKNLEAGTQGSLSDAGARAGVRTPAQQVAHRTRQNLIQASQTPHASGIRNTNQGMMQRLKNLSIKGKAGLAAGGLGLLGLGAYGLSGD